MALFNIKTYTLKFSFYWNLKFYFFTGLDGESLSQKLKVDEIVEYLVAMKNKMVELPMMSDDPVRLSSKKLW